MSEKKINELKEKAADLQKELKELTPEELKQVNGGVGGKAKDAYIGDAATKAMDEAADRQVSRLAGASSAASIRR